MQYWSDGLGFHQADNHPVHELKPVTETPEVRRAREEHERLWMEAARLNGIDSDAKDYNENVDRFESEDEVENRDDDDDGELEGQVSNQHQSLSRYPALPYSSHIVPENARNFGRVVGDSVIVDALKSSSEPVARFARQQRQNEVDDDEMLSEPRGFFYSFDYPVPFLKRTVSAEASERYEAKVAFDTRNPLKVHDAQVRPIVTAVSESKRKVLEAFVDDESTKFSSKAVEPIRSIKQHDVTVTAAPSAKKYVKNRPSNRGSIKFKSNSKI